MPDLTIITVGSCQSNEEWETTVPSSDGKTAYTVRFTKVFSGNVQYDYTCTCKGFSIRKKCSHIERVKSENRRCGWDGLIDGGSATDGKCPRCGGPVFYYRAGV